MSVKVGDVPADKVEEALEEAYQVYRYDVKLPLIVRYMMLIMPGYSGALLMSYIASARNAGELVSPLPYADIIEQLSSVAWTKPTAQPHAVQRTYEFSDAIDDACKEEAFRRVRLIK